MRKIIAKYLTLVFIVFITIPAWSQPNFNDSIEAYNYWGKRGIVQVVYSYMQDYVATNPKDSAENRGMEAYYEKFVKGINSKSVTDIENNFNDLNHFLSNNGWSKTAEKLVSPLTERLEKKQKFDSSFFSIFEHTGAKYMQEVQNIVTNYTQSVQIFRVNKNLQNYQWLITAFILGAVLGSLFIYSYSKHKVLLILESEKYEYNRILKENGRNPLLFRFISFVEILKNRKDEYKSVSKNMISEEQVVILKQEITDLKTKNKELFDKNIEFEQKLEKLMSNGTSAHPEIESPDGGINPITLYFSIPEIDGTFKTVNAKDHKEQDSFYKIELISNTNGNIYFLPGDFDLRAIENIDYYLNPVCEVQNIANRTFAKKVEVIRQGSILLKGDLWQINDKIKIKLV